MYETLTAKQFRELTVRTLSNGFFIEKNTSEMHCLHGAIGMVTEGGELLQAILKPHSDERTVNIGEEIADARWYITIFEREFGFDFSNVQLRINGSPLDLTLDLLNDMIEVLDMYKKRAFYPRDILRQNLHSKLASVVASLETLTTYFNLKTEVILAKNINKHLVRYPNNFSAESANNRNLEAEYKVLK